MTGGSPSLARSRRMVVLTAVVNGSAASSQTRSSSSSAETTRPGGGEQALQHGELLRAEVQAPPGPGRDPAGRVEGQVAAAPASGGSGGVARRASARMRATSSAKSNGLGR